MAKEELKKQKKSKGKIKAAAKETATAAAAPAARAAAVASVAAFLEAGGFARTLAAFQSEADLKAGAWRSSPVNFEELVAKFLDSSNPTPVVVTEESNEQDKTTGDALVEEVRKKKKKVKKTDAEAGESEKKASDSSDKGNPSENAGGEVKEKKQKRKDDSSTVNAGSDEATETLKNDDKEPDGKKKKKKSKKQEKDDDVEVRLEKVELATTKKFEAPEKLNGDGDKSRHEEPKVQDDDGKNNGVVEKKDKSVTEADGAKGKSGAADAVKDDNEKKTKKKRKKSDPDENVLVEGKEVAGKDSLPKPEDENKSGMEIEDGDSGKPSNSNATVHNRLSEYTLRAREVHRPEYDPSTEDIDGELVMRVGGGKKHTRYGIGENTLDTATTPTLFQIRARNTNSRLTIRSGTDTTRPQMEALEAPLQAMKRLREEMEADFQRMEAERLAQHQHMFQWLQNLSEKMGLPPPPAMLFPPPPPTATHNQSAASDVGSHDPDLSRWRSW